MADRISEERRSWNMSRIRGTDTGPERAVRSILHRAGYRFRLKPISLPGRPDVVLTRHRTVVFVHGCFWHGHEGCKYFVIPKTRTEWWVKKININIANGIKVVKLLQEDGWKVIHLWECDLKANKLRETFSKLPDVILS